VAMAFLKSGNETLQVNHLNGIKTDNSKINLEWATASQNGKHAFNIGIRVCATRKLTEYQVKEIKNLSLHNIDIAKKHNVSRRTIADIKNKKTWVNI